LCIERAAELSAADDPAAPEGSTAEAAGCDRGASDSVSAGDASAPEAAGSCRVVSVMLKTRGSSALSNEVHEAAANNTKMRIKQKSFFKFSVLRPVQGLRISADSCRQCHQA